MPRRLPADSPPSAAAEGDRMPAAPGSPAHPGALLAGSLALVGMALLPLAGGGYSGAGYIIALVLLPLCTALAWPLLRRRPLLVQLGLLAYLASAVSLPALVQEGRNLWGWLLPLPLGWVLVTLLLRQVPERHAWLWPVLCGSAGATAVYGLLIFAIDSASSALPVRLSSTFGLPNAYAGYLLLAWPVAGIGLLQVRTRLGQLLYGGAGLAIVAAFVLTFSRAALYVFVLQVLGLALVLGIAKLRGRAPVSGTAHFPPLLRFGGGILAVLLGLLLLPSVRTMLARLTDFGGYSMQGRQHFWEAALAIWRDHPLLGIGLGNFGYIYPQYQRDIAYYSIDPHSWLLQLPCELGVPGAFLALGICVGTVRWLWQLWTGCTLADAGPGLAPAGITWTEAALLSAAVLGSLAHAAVDFDYTFSATTVLLGALLAYGTWRAKSQLEAGATLTHAQDPPALQAGAAPARPRVHALTWLTCGLLVAVAVWGVSFSAERYVLDRLRDTPSIAPAAGLAMLDQALRANPWNHATHYQLAAALAQPGERFDYDRALSEVNIALRLNPSYALGYALRALLEDQRGKEAEAEADIKRALELDPWNYPEHYFYHAVIARDDETKRQRLLVGITKIGVAEPVLASGPRPDWVRLNGLFARWYYVLASLTKDKTEAATYRARAARFEQAAQLQRTQDAAARGEPLPPGTQGT